MDQELTQRVIGAIVITALAAIFIPMLFDDPVNNGEQMVNKLEIPEQQFPGDDPSLPPLPDGYEEMAGEETIEPENPTGDAGFADAESSLSDQELMAEPPSTEVEIDEQQEFAATPQTPPKPNEKRPVESKPQSLSQAGHAKKVSSKPPVTNKPHANAQPAAHSEANKPGLKRWYIQVGSFSKKRNADALADKLKKQGLPVFMETLQVAGKGTFYRLRVGPELDKKRAQAMQKKLDRQKIASMLLAE